MPYYLDDPLVITHLFGEKVNDLYEGPNFLMTHQQLESWFDGYQFVIIPADPQESPITRWKIETLSPDISNTVVQAFEDPRPGHEFHPKVREHLEGRELSDMLSAEFVCHQGSG